MNKMSSNSDQRVRLEQVDQGAQIMSIALRSTGTAEDEVLARIIEAIAQIVRESGR